MSGRDTIDSQPDEYAFEGYQRFVLSQLKQFGTEDAWKAVTEDATFAKVYDHTDLEPWKRFVAACYPACIDPLEIVYEGGPESCDL